MTMSTQAPTENTESQTMTAEPVDAQSAEEEKLIPASRFNGLKSEAARMKAELEQFKKLESEREQKARAEEENKAIAAQEFDKVLKTREQEINDLKSRLDAIQAESRRTKTEKTLMQNGATNPLMIEGLISRWHNENVSDEDFSDWLEAQKKAYPDAFKAHGPVMTAHVGNAASSARGDAGSTAYKSKDDLRAAFRGKLFSATE
jgi:hypothetical protein